MNFGTIKEGELVVYEGLPWKVKNIAFQTIFENEFLDSKQIRIQISEIVKLHSRKILPKEQWFPSRTGDWVLLKDNSYGQVVSQTLEQVVLEILGASRKYYRTKDYLDLVPTNMSSGFVIENYWPIDYSIQGRLIAETLPQLKTQLMAQLNDHKLDPREVEVSFSHTSANNLELYVMAKFDGNLAPKRAQIIRDINTFLLNIATKEKWTTPYPQMVVHQAKDGALS